MKKPKRYKLNCQGLARRDSGLMTKIIAAPGRTIISIDLSAGEPSVTANFSGDKNYRWATLDGVGQAPFYRDGVLTIDDIYLMTASASSMYKQALLDAFNRDWDGKTFVEQWLADSEVIKGYLKKLRQVAKILCLGLGYGMQPRKMVKQMYEQGVSITFQEASDFFNTYWGLFADVRKFSMKLQNQVKHDGFIINPFGYRMVCEPRLAFNYFIQSSVSGIMHVFLAKLVAAAPYSTFYTVIHDELLMEVDDHMLDQFRIDTRLATDSLNEDLNWSVKIRTGFVAGKDLYNAK